MSDLATDVTPFTELPSWRALEREFEAGDIPHCRAISAPATWHTALSDRLARLTLGLGPDAPSPVTSGHPDLLVVGEVDKAPDISGCRMLIQYLALEPMASVRRFGIVMAADRLLLPAANSLLKLAEEPPPHACILFLLADGGQLLPTLRSRARFTALSVPLEVKAVAPPVKDAEWLAWIESARTKDADAIAAALEGWGAWACAKGDFHAAGCFERLRIIAGTKNLSASMLCDLLILALREELPFEHLFGDFR